MDKIEAIKIWGTIGFLIFIGVALVVIYIRLTHEKDIEYSHNINVNTVNNCSNRSLDQLYYIIKQWDNLVGEPRKVTYYSWMPSKLFGIVKGHEAICYGPYKKRESLLDCGLYPYSYVIIHKLDGQHNFCVEARECSITFPLLTNITKLGSGEHLGFVWAPSNHLEKESSVGWYFTGKRKYRPRLHRCMPINTHKSWENIDIVAFKEELARRINNL